MAWRGLHLSRKAQLAVDRNCLLVETEDGAIRLAFEDLSHLVVDTREASFTAALLARLAAENVLVVVVDERHLPVGALLPLQGHFRQVGTLRRQLAASKALKDRLWQGLIRRKIENQGQALAIIGAKGDTALRAMAERVRPGDPDNLEGMAAKEFFSNLFQGFRRRRDGDVRNALLNYGYAIVRAAIARDLAAQGFHPALGIHHDSVENAFNLADDLIEPFRPIVDLLVVERLEERDPDDGEEPTLADKRAMAGILTRDVAMPDGVHALIHAGAKMADGLLAAMVEKDPERLPLPRPLVG